jgi:hypothetical protein
MNGFIDAFFWWTGATFWAVWLWLLVTSLVVPMLRRRARPT